MTLTVRINVFADITIDGHLDVEIPDHIDTEEDLVNWFDDQDALVIADKVVWKTPDHIQPIDGIEYQNCILPEEEEDDCGPDCTGHGDDTGPLGKP